MSGARLRGLYAITPDALTSDPDRLLDACAAALRGGARLLQYRDKRSPAPTRLVLARTLAALCRTHGALLVVNDDVRLAIEAGAHGVHLGAGDGSLADARRQLGSAAIVGATCGNDLARADAAVDAGASYVAFGRLYPSRSKAGAPPADLATLTRARERWPVAVCGIGGITPALAPAVVAAGADLVAAIDGVFGAADVEAAARAYAQAFDAGNTAVETGN
ncbi:thiamine phosphate synthase [Sinimarinibacterium flocculans]|uniref:thiamine phosphate synthase n=1 Tax=Sinimarinibacterium flocculans TaxID=985250 RepID=UPI003515342B